MRQAGLVRSEMVVPGDKNSTWRFFVTVALTTSLGVPSFVAEATPTVKPLAVCITASGSVVAKAKCSKSERAITLASLQAIGIRGAAGEKGDPGEKGATGARGPSGSNLLDLSQCTDHTKSGQVTGSGFVDTTCGDGEYLLTHGFDSGGNANISSISLIYNGNPFPVGVHYFVHAVDALPYFVVAKAFCCKYFQ